MVEVKNEEQEETMREVGHLLLEVKCLARLGALASDSCIGWKAGIVIIIIEWLIFLHIYHSIWPEAFS